MSAGQRDKIIRLNDILCNIDAQRGKYDTVYKCKTDWQK